MSRSYRHACILGRTFLGVGLALLLLGGCGRKDPWDNPDPAEVLKAYLTAVELRQMQLVWEFLLPEDRAALEAIRERFVALGGDSRQAFAFLGPGHVASSSREWALVKLEESASTDEEAVVRVVLHDERNFTVSLKKIDSRWYVDLPLEVQTKESAP